MIPLFIIQMLEVHRCRNGWLPRKENSTYIHDIHAMKAKEHKVAWYVGTYTYKVFLSLQWGCRAPVLPPWFKMENDKSAYQTSDSSKMDRIWWKSNKMDRIRWKSDKIDQKTRPVVTFSRSSLSNSLGYSLSVEIEIPGGCLRTHLTEGVRRQQEVRARHHS
jgi:hypothetical protein